MSQFRVDRVVVTSPLRLVVQVALPVQFVMAMHPWSSAGSQLFEKYAWIVERAPFWSYVPGALLSEYVCTRSMLIMMLLACSVARRVTANAQRHRAAITCTYGLIKT